MSRYTIAALVVASVVSGAAGQTTWNPDTGWSYGYYGGDMALTWDGEPIAPTCTGQADGFVLRYDATAVPVLPPSNDSIAWSMRAERTFHVGPVPVEATLTMHVNAKLVNGGGTAAEPTTDLSWGTSLHYDLDGDHSVSSGDVAVPAFSLSTGTQLVGNGLTVIDDTQTMTASFILAPEFDYILQLHQYHSLSDLPLVPLASTIEAGGETSYSGITMTLNATPVPEPATMALLALGGVAMLKRRRR
jgi:PEP-CTERM motif